jgi:hypothetical protein
MSTAGVVASASQAFQRNSASVTVLCKGLKSESRMEWERIRPLCSDGQGDVFLVRSPARTA